MRIISPTRREFTRFCAAASLFGSAAARGAETGNPAIAKAMEAVRASIATAESDPERPGYHFRPPAHWNNDPNGTIFYKGWHHLFYQHNPFGSEWGHMHWGHARSRDLVNWEHLPIALWPSLEKGEEHVFSGCAALHPDGRPRLLYTSIGRRQPEQWMAEPLDDELIAWKKFEGNPVATVQLHGGQRIADWRDPFVFDEGGKRYMVLGGNGNGRRTGGAGAVYLYEAVKADLTEWKYLGPVFEHRNREIINVECPNLFKLGSKWVVLMSPQNPCEYFIGDLDLKRPRFIPDSHGILDPGPSYASNISWDDAGRTILWLWGRTDTKPGKGWNSVMTLPRILSIGEDGFLRQNPAPEFEQLRGEARRRDAIALGAAPVSLSETISGDSLEIDATFSLGDAKTVGLRVRSGGSGQGIRIACGAHAACSFPPDAGVCFSVGDFPTQVGRGRSVRVRVFVDKCVVEAYADDGAAAIFASADTDPRHLGVEAFAEGGNARLGSFQAWPLKGARFSLDRYRV